MNMHFKFNIYILTLLSFFMVINVCVSNNKRENEAQCSSRRCCKTRKEFRKEEGIINCGLLSDRECGQHNEHCRWNCHSSSNNEEQEDPFIKKYRGISTRQGSYRLPRFDPEDSHTNRRKHVHGSKESKDEFVRDSQWISMDDCGVMYDVEMKPDIINQLYDNPPVAQFAAGKKMNELNQNEELLDEDGMKRRLPVLGPDGRWETESDSWPYSTVLYLTYDTPQGIYRCTATMISERWALTAAHCVYGNGDWYKNFKLFHNIHDCCGIYENNFFGNYYKGIDTWMLTGYANTGLVQYDMAMIELDTAPGLGSLGFGYDTEMTSAYMNMISHPGDNNCDKMVQENALYDLFYESEMWSSVIDGSTGASGSAIWQINNKITTVYGVFTTAYHDLNGVPTYNGGPRITPSRYNMICAVINDGRCG